LAVTSSEQGLDLAFLAEYAAKGLAQRCVKQGMLFSTNRVEGAIPIVIEVSSYKIDEEVKVIPGVNITEYYATCDFQGCVQASPSPAGKCEIPRMPFHYAESALKHKEGTETFQSPTAALDEAFVCNSMFGRSLAGRVFDRALQQIAGALCPEKIKQ
jgi:hypothetical protein